jgi:hypothetical protein
MQMNLWLVIGIIAFCVAMTGVISANMFVLMMIGEINRKKEDGKPISYVGFTPPKTLQIFGEYRRLYPNGKLQVYSLGMFAIGMIALAVAVVIYLRFFDT